MTTKAPAGVNYFESDQQIKMLYTAIDELQDVITIENERNRLSFCLNLYLAREIETIYDAILQAKPASSTVDYKVLEGLVTKKFKEKGIYK
jgi:hypothetical protein